MARDNFSWGSVGSGKEGVDYGNTNNWGDKEWTDYESKYNIPHPGAQPIGGGVAAPSTSPITTQQQVGNTTANVGQTTPQGAPTTVAQSFQQALVNKLNQGPISASSPEVQPAIQANQLSEQRSFERDRAMQAERAAANGQDLSGGFESILNGLSQNRAQREGQFAGNAVMQGNQERGMNERAAMGSAMGLLGGNSSQSLAQTLAELQAQVTREGQGIQNNLGQGQLQLGQGQLNLGLLQALLGNNQFGQSLAQNGAQFGASLSQQGLLSLLAGL